MEELIKLLDLENCETKEDFLALKGKADAMFEELSPEEQEIIIEENVFEPLSMIISGYEYEEERLSKLVPKGLIRFNEEQINFMKSLGLEFNFNNLSVDNLVKIEEVAANELQRSGFDENYNITDVGQMCESIFDALGDGDE